MIDPKALTTYAQYNEDLVLLALFPGITKGFYVDVGANDPTIDSATKIFYQKGWNGINIEPVKSMHRKLVRARKRDININCGAGDKEDELLLREYIDAPGHSTFVNEHKAQHKKTDKYKDYKVPIKTLASIFWENKVGKINFLKIDVEGFELEVIRGNDWKKFRPQVLCIESNQSSKDWSSILINHNYILFIRDGLNDYYLAKEYSASTNGYSERIVNIDYHALKQHQVQSWRQDSQQLVRLTEMVSRQDERIKQLERENSKLSRLSLSDHPWLSRLKRSIYGLTVDWINSKNKK